MSDMTTRREAFAKVLTDHGIVPNENGFHAWRCEHPDRYPDYCHCVPDLLDALEAAAALSPAGVCPTCDCWGGEHRPAPEAVR